MSRQVLTLAVLWVGLALGNLLAAFGRTHNYAMAGKLSFFQGVALGCALLVLHPWRRQ